MKEFMSLKNSEDFLDCNQTIKIKANNPTPYVFFDKDVHKAKQKDAEDYFSDILKVNGDFLKAIENKDQTKVEKYLHLGYPLNKQSVLFKQVDSQLLSDAFSDALDDKIYITSQKIYLLLIKEDYRDMFDLVIPFLYEKESEKIYQDLYFRAEYDEKRFDRFFKSLLEMQETSFNFFSWVRSAFLNKNIFMANRMLDFFINNRNLIKKKSRYGEFSEVNALNYFAYEYDDDTSLVKVNDFVRTDAVLKYVDIIIDDLVAAESKDEKFINYMSMTYPKAKKSDLIWKEKSMRSVMNRITVRSSIPSLMEEYKDLGQFNPDDMSLYNGVSMRCFLVKKLASLLSQDVYYFLIDNVLLNLKIQECHVISEERSKANNPSAKILKSMNYSSFAKRSLNFLDKLIDTIIGIAQSKLDAFELLDFLQSRGVDPNKYAELQRYCMLSKQLDKPQDDESDIKRSGRGKI